MMMVAGGRCHWQVVVSTTHGHLGLLRLRGGGEGRLTQCSGSPVELDPGRRPAPGVRRGRRPLSLSRGIVYLWNKEAMDFVFKQNSRPLQMEGTKAWGPLDHQAQGVVFTRIGEYG